MKRVVIPLDSRPRFGHKPRVRNTLPIWLVAAGLAGGCVGTPEPDTRLHVPGEVVVGDFENPILVMPGDAEAGSYADVFSAVTESVTDFFDIAHSNRYDGRIICLPRIAPGYEQPWKAGSPSVHERWVSTFQTMRYRCRVGIQAAPQGGYFVEVIVFKDLLDDPRPMLPNSGVASFQGSPTTMAQFEVVDPSLTGETGQRWIPKGRDHAFEREIVRRIQKNQSGH